MDCVSICTCLKSRLHRQCEAHLKTRGCRILHSIDLNETFTDDGLIRACLSIIPQLWAMMLAGHYRKLLPNRSHQGMLSISLSTASNALQHR